MNLKNKAEEFINDHNSPVVKIDSFGSKLYLSGLTEKEEGLKTKCLEGTERVLRHNRVDRRIARSVAEWLPDQNLSQVTKINGSFISAFGFQNKDGKFLNNEESLFLLETNKLELRLDKVPLSIQEAYKVIKLNYGKYQVYKKLVLQGFKVKPVKVNPEIQQKLESCDEGPAPKIAKLGESMDQIFEKLREMGPQTFQLESNKTQSVDYLIKTTNLENVNVIIDSPQEFTSVDPNQDNSTLYAFCSDDNVSFYNFYSTSLPNL